MSLRGVDLSSYNGAPGQWQAQASDIGWAAVKATELQSGGVKYVSPTLGADVQWLRDHGKGVVFYLFAHASAPVADTVDLFATAVAPLLRREDGVCIDLEVNDGKTPAEVAAWARDVAAELRKRYRRTPLTYTDISFAQAGNCEGLGDTLLWIAAPSDPEGKPTVPGPWKTWAIQQYVTGGVIDRDVANYPDLAAMEAAMGDTTPVLWTTTGTVTLREIADAVKEMPSTILRESLDGQGEFAGPLSHYVSAGDWNKLMPAGIGLKLPRDPVFPAHKGRLRLALKATFTGTRKAAKAGKKALAAEPLLTAGGVSGILGVILTWVLPRFGVHLSANWQDGILTALPALSAAWGALKASPPRVSVIAGALGTLATATAAFGVHLPAPVIGLEMPIASMLVALIASLRTTPKKKP